LYILFGILCSSLGYLKWKEFERKDEIASQFKSQSELDEIWSDSNESSLTGTLDPINDCHYIFYGLEIQL